MATQFEKVDTTEERLLEELGAEEFLNALLKAMSYDDKENYLAYLCRVYDIPTECEEV